MKAGDHLILIDGAGFIFRASARCRGCRASPTGCRPAMTRAIGWHGDARRNWA